MYDAKALEVLSIEKAEPDASASVAALKKAVAKGTSNSAEISIAKLLGLVKGDAEKYLPSKKNKRYSRVTELDKLSKQNEALREKVDYLQGQMKLTKEKSVRPGDVEKLSRDIISVYSSMLEVSDISARMQALGDFIVRGYEGDEELSFDGAKERATDIAPHEGTHVMKQVGYKPYLDFIKLTPDFLNYRSEDFEDLLNRVSKDHRNCFTV